MFLARKKFINFLKYIFYYTYYIHVYKNFSITLNAWERQTTKREIENHKLNEMGSLKWSRESETDLIKVKDHHMF